MTDILHITDRERTQAAVIRALESARDEMDKRIEALTVELAEQRLRFVAAFGQEQERGWQPIETAPRDGTEFLMTNGVNVSSGQWFAGDNGTCDYDGAPNCDEKEAGWMDWSGGMQPDPTHWQPLPPPPTDKPIWDQLADIGASDPQAWDKP